MVFFFFLFLKKKKKKKKKTETLLQIKHDPGQIFLLAPKGIIFISLIPYKSNVFPPVWQLTFYG